MTDVIMAQTRNQDQCTNLGSPEQLSNIVLPTREDVLRYYNWLKMQKENQGNYKPKVGDICEEIASKLEEIWSKASIPILHRIRIITLIKKEHEKLRNLLKSHASRKSTLTMQSKIQRFKEEAKVLFDIAACKCTNYDYCSCEKSRKVPARERAFLSDQRSTRFMFIGSVDIRTSQQLQRSAERKMKDQALEKTRTAEAQDCNTCIKPLQAEVEYVSIEDKFLAKRHDEIALGETRRTSEITSSIVSVTSSTACTTSASPTPFLSPSTKSTTQTRIHLPTFARTCDRYGIADRPAAALASALLHDVSDQDHEGGSSSQIIVDRSKVRRERSKLRKNLLEETKEIDIELHGLYFDGRKDKTLVIEKTEDGSSHRRCKIEERTW